MEIWYTLTGIIDQNIVAQTINWIQAQLFAASTIRISKLTFFISSIGGDADSAIRLFDYLTALPFQVNTFGFGQIYSAGVTIFLAGENRFTLKKTKFLVHEGIYTIGQPSAPMHLHDENLTILKELANRNIEIIANRSGKTISQIREMMKDVKVLNAEQAKNAGIATQIADKLPNSPLVQTQAPQTTQ